MCCIITAFIIFGPRIALFIWWLVNPIRFGLAFDTWIIPLVFAIFAPYTMIAFLLVWSPQTGIQGLDWLWLAIGILFDISSYTSGRQSNRRRLRRAG